MTAIFESAAFFSTAGLFAQAPTTTATAIIPASSVSLLFPAPNPSDFISGTTADFQLWHYDPASGFWSQLPATRFQSAGDAAVGLVANVSSSNGQYAITKKSDLPTGNSCGLFAPNDLRKGSSAKVSIATGATTRNLQFKLYNLVPELVASFSQDLEPGTYTINLSNNMGIAFDIYVLIVQIDGSVVRNEKVLAGN